MKLLCFIFCIVLAAFPVLSQKNTDYKFSEKVDHGVNKTSSIVLKEFREANKLSKFDSLVLVKSKKDKQGVLHHTFRQYNNGVGVESAFISFHSMYSRLISYNGNIKQEIPVFDTKNLLSEKEIIVKTLDYIGAERYAFEDTSYTRIINTVTKGKVTSLFPEVKLIILQHENAYKLVFKLQVHSLIPQGRHIIYMDAYDGTVIKEIEMTQHITGTCSTMHHGTQDIEFDQQTPGLYKLTNNLFGIQTFLLPLGASDYSNASVPTSTTTDWSSLTGNDRAALDVHWATKIVFDFFNSHSIYSYDDNGATISSYVNYGYNASSQNNAFWNGFLLTYGSGGGGNFPGPVATLDVVAHEFTHALTELFGGGLVYQDESGAINESLSDIWSSLIEKSVNNSSSFNNLSLNEWIVSDLNGNGIRDLSNPGTYNDPDTYHGNNWVFSAIDHGGVHSNSGVGNFWYYLLANGGSGVNDNGFSYSVNSIPVSTLIPILINTYDYLNPNSTYLDLRYATIQASLAVTSSCAITQEIMNAWNAVGVGDTSDVCMFSYVPLEIVNLRSQFCIGDTQTFYNQYVNVPAFNYTWTLDNDTVSMPITMNTEGISTLKLIATDTLTGTSKEREIQLYITDCQPIIDHAGVWYFGHKSGFDFSSGIAEPISYPYSNTYPPTGYSKNGNLEYYISATSTTNNINDYKLRLIDKNHVIIDSLTDLNAIGPLQTGCSAANPDTSLGQHYVNLFINGSGTYSGLHRVIIDVYTPGNPQLVSITPVAPPSSNFNLDFDSNSGAISTFGTTTIIASCDPNVYWVLLNSRNECSTCSQLYNFGLSVYKLDYNSSPLGSLSYNSFKETYIYDGTINVAPNGQYFAAGDTIYKFDRAAGTITSLAGIPHPTAAFSVSNLRQGAFSPNSRFFYTARYANVFQYDVLDPDFEGSKTLVGNAPILAPLTNSSQYILNKRDMALGPDGKIYIGFIGGSNGTQSNGYTTYDCKIGVINNPNFKETNDNLAYNAYGYNLINGASASNPFFNFPGFMEVNNFNDEPLEFITTQNNCYEVNLLAPPCRLFYSWNFGDGNTQILSSLNNINHTYADTGTYIISLTSNINGLDTTVFDTIRVGFLDVVDIVAPDTLCTESFFVAYAPVGYASYHWSILQGPVVIADTAASSTGFTMFGFSPNLTIQLVVTDENGCSKTVTKTVCVVDGYTPPVPDNFIIDTAHACLPFMPQIPTATDKCGNTLVGTTTTPLPIITPGLTNITWQYVDSDGNTSSQIQLAVYYEIDSGITFNGSVLTAFQSNYVSYQWINCDTGDSIQGATNQIFVPQNNGNFAVILTSGNCIVQSSCIEVTGLSIGNSFGVNKVNIYPNPAKNILTIDSSQPIHFKIYDVNGKLLLSGKNKSVFVGDFERATYIIAIYNSLGELLHSESLIKL
ncbi:hypothetical protein DNU06_17020 [Putridiphycobacter roseus]|uniref:PKD domain-containing protein n=1 Tax=Putridiphycobacter roseus TaxID=2219161 RepID=A0A2W1N8Q8_9FLAO|nr:M4 family metallopeptidase [Putridiphycobacter roseus]PZE15635.1 hypothetical protein DNU06_17020 [Putridiphycobacter roseus]